MSQLERLGKYQIIEEIGYGGFAAVYKAFDAELQRTVALKVMHPYWHGDPGFVRRFRREGQTMAQLHHPNIAAVYESGTIDDQLYIAMEYLQGRALSDALKEDGVLPLEQAVLILDQIASALDYAHRHGMIHRDVKPANVILDESTGEIRATLLDFGLVKALAGSSALTSHGMLVGSPEYMAPEQANLERRRDVGPAADRYSLGVLAYRMLTGRVPFPGNTPATLNAHENKAVPPPQEFRPDLPDEIAATLLIMLAKVPEERFKTARAFVAQLRVVVEAQANRQRRETQLNDLYTRLEAATRAKHWSEVLSLAGQIQALDRHYRDVQSRIDSAQRELDASTPFHKKRPVWPWIVVIILGLVVIGGIAWWSVWFPGEPSPPRNATLGTTWTRPADGMAMVYVPPGTFLMGAADGDPDEKPVHSVTLAGFWLDRTEVTQAQYARCVSDGVCALSRLPREESLHPIVGVAWGDAVAYCAWAGARLPTAAEWEYAYRGMSARRYSWGDTFDGARLNFCDVNCAEEWADVTVDDGYAQVAPVGTFPGGKSWCGAQDMAGNVWEWVQDWYSDAYYDEAPLQNPSGPQEGSFRGLRGGSWRSAAYNVRGSYRYSMSPDQSDETWGFRCAYSDD